MGKILLTLALGLTLMTSVKAEVIGEISRIGDATHVEFKGQKEWSYDVSTDNRNTVILKVAPISKASEAALRTWSDSLVKSIDINRQGPDNKYLITFTLKDNGVESFDYLTDDPSRLIIDFYRPPSGQKKSKAASTQKGDSGAKKSGSYVKSTGKKVAIKDLEKAYVKRDKPKSKKPKRDPAGDEFLKIEPDPDEEMMAPPIGVKVGTYDGNDPGYRRFQVKDYEIKEEAIISSRQNIYIRFPMLKMSSSRLKMLKANPPEYVIVPKDTDENKEARFIQVLHKNKRYAALLKSYTYFMSKYPNSDYEEILKHLAADTYFQLYDQTGDYKYYKLGKDMFTYLIAKFPESPLVERTQLYLAYSDLERGDGFNTIQRFQNIIKNYPGSSHYDQAHKALAEGYLTLNKYGSALDALRRLEQGARKKRNAIEATYRVGDVFFKQKRFEEAVIAYKKALDNHPEYEEIFPNANYNMAESLFWLGRDYKKSLNHFIKHLQLFPSHQHGGYALTRIGELLDKLGVDQGRVMGAYLESYFRFRESPGAGVARVRMLSQRMKVMKEKELKKALDEMIEISKKSKLSRQSEFVNLMIADGYHRRAEFKKALAFLIGYYQKHPTSTNLSFFRKRILENITDDLEGMVSRKDYMDVINTYSRYSLTWLKNSGRIDAPYFLGKAYEFAGVFGESENIYKKTLSHLEKIKGTQEEKERRVNEHLPSIDSVKLRLARVAMENRHYDKAYSQVTQIKDKKNSLTSPEKIERVALLARLAEIKGKVKRAKNYLKNLIKSWNGEPQLVSSAYLRLAKLEAKSKNYNKAESSLQKIVEMRKAKTPLEDDIWAETLETLGNIRVAKGQTLAAVETYMQLLDEYESKRPLTSIRYKAGEVLFKKGDIKGAEKIWSGLPEENSMYSRLAQEKLNQSQWNDDYNKYIKRIPAMSDLQ